MDMDERWVNRSPETMLETFHWFRGECFDLIIDDLLRLPAQPPVIAEGFRLLPGLVKPLLAEPGHALWLLPTLPFRRAAFESRGSLREIPARPATRTRPWVISLTVTGCSLGVSTEKRSASVCTSSRSTPRCPRTT